MEKNLQSISEIFFELNEGNMFSVSGETPENSQSQEKLSTPNHTHKSLLRLALPRRSLPSTTSLNCLENQELLPWSQSTKAKAALLSVVSALYALVLILLSLAFEISSFMSETIGTLNYNWFYIYLYVVSLVFFCYCYTFLLRTKGFNLVLPFHSHRIMSLKNRPSESSITVNHLNPDLSIRRKVTYSAKSAGSFYLRLGAIVFGIVGIVDRALQIYRVIDQGPLTECKDHVNMLEDAMAIVFVFVQMYFIFQNSKMTIHRFKRIGRLGSMHLIATNLCMWIRAIMVEEFYIVQEIEHTVNSKNHNLNLNKLRNYQTETPNPFNNNNDDGKILPFSTAGFDNTSLSCISDKKELVEMLKNAKPFMTTCIIEFALIGAGVMFIMWRNIGHQPHKRSKSRKQNFQIDCSSSTNGLFVGLLFLVFTLVSMIIFFAKVQLERNNEALWVFYFSDCFLYTTSIIAVSIGAYRMRNLYHVTYHSKGILLDDILLYAGLVGQLMFCIFSVGALRKIDLLSTMIVVVSLCRTIEVLMQTMFILVAQRLVALTPRMQTMKPGRELITFLLLSNLAMFLINIFETQKAGSNPLTIEFYGRSVWAVIVHSTVPLSTFYRFHSSVCFAEIWKKVYKFKEPDV